MAQRENIQNQLQLFRQGLWRATDYPNGEPAIRPTTIDRSISVAGCYGNENGLRDRVHNIKKANDIRRVVFNDEATVITDNSNYGEPVDTDDDGDITDTESVEAYFNRPSRVDTPSRVDENEAENNDY